VFQLMEAGGLEKMLVWECTVLKWTVYVWEC
jgi:hypothetical protein